MGVGVARREERDGQQSTHGEDIPFLRRGVKIREGRTTSIRQSFFEVEKE